MKPDGSPSTIRIDPFTVGHCEDCNAMMAGADEKVQAWAREHNCPIRPKHVLKRFREWMRG